MAHIPIHSLDDPRVAPYRALKERDLAREGGRFIAEGEGLVRQLLASRLATESLLVAERRVDAIMPFVSDGVPVYVAPGHVVDDVLGFKFHSGVMAVGIRPASPTIDEVMAGAAASARLLICPEIEKTDNLGALIRVGAAFGVDAMILGERCCDPFFRQSVRVSMGAAFVLPIVRSGDLVADLRRLREEHRVELVASVLDPGAEDLRRVTAGPRVALVLGNETRGIEDSVLRLCGRRVTLPMQLGTDSLNVAVAAGVFLYHLTNVQ